MYSNLITLFQRYMYDQIDFLEFYLYYMSRHHEKAHGVHQETPWLLQKVR
jgi:hypothetical protein